MIVSSEFSAYASVAGFVIGLPTVGAAYYQAWKARQEAARARAGLLFSKNCLEFVLADGSSVNVVPLETLFSLPAPGDIVLLPGTGIEDAGKTAAGAFRVGRIEHIYSHAGGATAGGLRTNDVKQARLIKAVAYVHALTEID